MSDDIAAFRAQFVEEIHAQTLYSAAQKIVAEGAAPGAQALAARAVTTCETISKQMRDLRARVTTVVANAGIACTPIEGPEDKNALQFHLTAIRVAPGDLAAAVEALHRLGFRAAFDLTPARLHVLMRTSRSLRLVRFDGVSSRIDIHFADRVASRLPRALHPRAYDLRVTRLPAALSAFYWVIRPVRLVTERLLGAAPAVGDNDLLGTPESLLEPILEAASVTPEDLVIDLGCGDGRVVEAAAARGAFGIGYEIDAALAETARNRVARFGERCHIYTKPAEKADLSEATLIFMFVPPHLATRLIPRALADTPIGCRIVAHEQTRSQIIPKASRQIPVISEDGITVVHIWQR